MQAISVPQIDRSHSGSSTPIIALIIGLDCFLPKLPDIGGTVLSETDIDQEIAVIIIRFEIRCFIVGGPVIDSRGKEIRCIPAAEGTCAVRFIVERCA